MSKIASLPGITTVEHQLLTQAGHTHVESVWRAIELRGPAAVCAQVSIGAPRLAELLGPAEAEAWRKSHTPWRDHLSGTCMHAAFTLALSAAVLALVALVQGHERIADAGRGTRYAVVRAPGVPAYSLIRADQIEVRTGPEGPAAADPAQIVGAYALAYLAPGTTVNRSSVGAGQLRPEQLAGRVVVSLPVVSGGVPKVRPPTDVQLMLSTVLAPSEKEPAFEVLDALLLNVTTADGSVTIDAAILPTDLPRIATLIGRAKVMVATTALETK